MVVSATASGTYEVQVTPFAQGIGGGEVHANVIDSLLRARAIIPFDTLRSVALTIGSAVVVGFIGAFVGVWALAAVASIVAAALVWISVRRFAAGVWMPLVTPLVAAGLTFVGELARQYFVEGPRKAASQATIFALRAERRLRTADLPAHCLGEFSGFFDYRNRVAFGFRLSAFSRHAPSLKADT